MKRFRPMQRPVQWLQAHPLIADWLLALAVTGLSIVNHWSESAASDGAAKPSALGTIITILATLPIAYRRYAPVAALAIVAPFQFLSELRNIEGGGWIGVLIGLYSLAAHTGGQQRSRSAAVFAVGCAGLIGIGYIRDELPLGGVISTVVVLTAAFILGDNLQRRRLHLVDLAERADRAERERELLAMQRVNDERARIARELHDVVAHSVSVMIIQSAGARRSLARNPQQAEQALLDLETTGRQTMQELRQVLGVLRSTDGAGELVPQPTLGNVRALLDSDPSLNVRLNEHGTAPKDLPPGVGLSLYRVIQEALTNVRKHAGPVAVVNVDVEYNASQVIVEVVDDGRGASVTQNSSGQGLVGMRERMALCGGSVSAGPHPGGGWRGRAERAASSGDRMIRVLLVDDQVMVRAGFRMILEAESDITVVGEATDGHEAIDQAERSSPDVILMDVRMPRLDGIEATKAILAKPGPPTPRVLILTTFDLDDYVYPALRAGASGFMLKDAPAEQLVEAIRIIAAGEALLAPTVTRRLIADLSRKPQRDELEPAPGMNHLTDREREVLRLVAKGLSNAEIAQQLFLGEATIKTHVGRMLTKLDLRDRVQAVVLAYESGLITPGDGEV